MEVWGMEAPQLGVDVGDKVLVVGIYYDQDNGPEVGTGDWEYWGLVQMLNTCEG